MNTDFIWWRISTFCDRKTKTGREVILPITKELLNRLDDDQIVMFFTVLCSNCAYTAEEFREAVMPLLEEIYMERAGVRVAAHECATRTPQMGVKNESTSQ